MRATHLECASEPGSPDHPNEDFVAAALPAAGQGGALVVLDGVTPPPNDDGCRHSVAWFTQRLGGALLAAATDEPGRPLPACLSLAIRRTADAHRDTCDLSHRRTPQATVVAVRWSGAALEYLVLSDSVLLVETAGETEAADGGVRAIVDPALDRVRDAVASLPRAGRAARVEAARNVPGGFWTAAADPSVAAHAVHGALPLGGVRAVAALTDGVGRYHEVFGLGGWADLCALLRDAGPRAAITAVRAAERADPAGTDFPRGKAHDDATVAYLGGF